MNRVSTPPVKRRDSHALLRRVGRCWQLYMLILPPVITVFIFHYLPIYGLQIAFRNYRPTRGIWGSDWEGLKWFVQFVTYPDFWPIFAQYALHQPVFPGDLSVRGDFCADAE